jgi:hypothetical protein
MTDQAQSPHDDGADDEGATHRPLSPGEALAAYKPTGNLRDDDDMGGLDENDLPGDPPFNLEELKRRLDEALFPGYVVTGDGLPRPMMTYSGWKAQLSSLDQILSRHHGICIVDSKGPAVEMFEEKPFVFRTPDEAAKFQKGAREEDDQVAEGFHLELHLASAHDDDQAFFRTVEQNEEAHRSIPGFLHQHPGVQHRYELALIQKIEADLGDGTTLSWCPVPHPPHEVTDLARMIGDIHDQSPEMAASLIAVDLAWIKTAAWPWHRRLRAAALIAFPFAWPPSRYLGKRARGAVRR